MNLSFHLENSFSCWTHITPFLMVVSLPRMLEVGSELSVREGLGTGQWLTRGRLREKSSSVTALGPSPPWEATRLVSLPGGLLRPPVLLGSGFWWLIDCCETARGILKHYYHSPIITTTNTTTTSTWNCKILITRLSSGSDVFVFQINKQIEVFTGPTTTTIIVINHL